MNKDTNVKQERTIVDYLRVAKVEGEVGIEIEIEGDGVGDIVPDNVWRIEGDGSLRGDSAEFVLRKPAKRAYVPVRLKRFKNLIKTIKVDDTGRAGIHVHINVQELTPQEVIKFICLYMIFEDILVQWCGSSRVGNLFCLRTADAPWAMKNLRDIVRRGNWRDLGDDRNRYSSLNLKALAEYGSLEFRAMRSTDDIQAIQHWIDLLLRLKDKSKEFASPVDIVEQLSFRGPDKFFNDIIGDLVITPPLVFDHHSMMEGVRHAQFVAYVKGHWEGKKDEFQIDTEPKWELDNVQVNLNNFVEPPEIGDHEILDDDPNFLVRKRYFATRDGVLKGWSIGPYKFRRTEDITLINGISYIPLFIEDNGYSFFKGSNSSYFLLSKDGETVLWGMNISDLIEKCHNYLHREEDDGLEYDPDFVALCEILKKYTQIQ